MLFILSGQDDFSISQELERIKRDAGDQSMLATNTSVLDGGQVSLDEFHVACETVPFLSEKRLVIAYGLLERFAAKTTPIKATKTTETRVAAWEPFAAVIQHIPPSTVLVLVDSTMKDNKAVLLETNPMLKAISASGVRKSFPMLKAAELQQWAKQRVTDEGGTIAPAAVSLLTRIIGSNLWIMSSEINKLVLYADGRQIEEKDVQALVSYSQDASVFTMVDAIIEFNIQRAESLLQQLLKEGATPTSLLAMLNRQMRLIVRAKDLKQQRVNETEIRTRLGIAQDWLVRKTVEQSNRYTMPRLKEVYEKLLETDLAIKTGKFDGELALNVLVAELCQRQGSEPKQRIAV